ncbi:hypothetical protein [Kineococcus terrestris]|uniref:hypothetical protein n=1 Tax=Kineococcus terrestris TaxID=2044856 RepID=UPI0034DB0FC1
MSNDPIDEWERHVGSLTAELLLPHHRSIEQALLGWQEAPLWDGGVQQALDALQNLYSTGDLLQLPDPLAPLRASLTKAFDFIASAPDVDDDVEAALASARSVTDEVDAELVDADQAGTPAERRALLLTARARVLEVLRQLLAVHRKLLRFVDGSNDAVESYSKFTVNVSKALVAVSSAISALGGVVYVIDSTLDKLSG